MIQRIISRLARNSFQLRRWSVLIVAAVIALTADGPQPRYAIIAVVPFVTFWILDACYLVQERLFRSLYDCVRTAELTDFSMNTVRFAASPWRGFLAAAGSKTMLLFHGGLLATYFFAIFFLTR